jgi:multicomponent Na+:H+ antiporter subunit F
MPEFLIAAAVFLLLLLAAGLARLLRGPSQGDRVMVALLLGSGGIGILLLAAGAGLPAALDAALLLAALAAFACVAFVKSSPAAREHNPGTSHQEHEL